MLKNIKSQFKNSSILGFKKITRICFRFLEIFVEMILLRNKTFNILVCATKSGSRPIRVSLKAFRSAQFPFKGVRNGFHEKG